MDPQETGAAQPAEAPPNGGDPTAESQGGIGDLYDLSATPEELRPYMEQELRKVNANVEQKFREHADFRKQFEPFDGIEGLTDVPREELEGLVQLRGLVQEAEQGKPEALQQWWDQVGEEMGFFDDGDPAGAGGEGGDGFEPEGFEDEPPPWASEMAERLEKLEQGIGPLSEHVSSQEQIQRQQAAEQWTRGEFDKLKEEHGEFDQDVVGRLAMSYTDENGALTDDAIVRGFEDYRKITGQAQGELVDGKASQPGPATSGGSPDTSPEEFHSLDDPDLKAAAKARFAGKV